MKMLKKIIWGFFNFFGYSISRNRDFSIISHQNLLELNRLAEFGKHRLNGLLEQSQFYEDFSESFISDVESLSKSQLGQDVLALSIFGPLQKGFFVEFGATNGVDFSNTWLLEAEFDWGGILCEPGRSWHLDLKSNRSASVDTRCVYSSSGLQVDFLQVDVAELSTISGFGASDSHSANRNNHITYQVETVSLLDLLREHSAPRFIEFLSLDTEGSEFEILQDFDFTEYSFGLICVEHNYTDNRGRVMRLLQSKGYRRIYPEISAFDDWFVPK
jgi:FkbM family methyltransferase